MGRLELGFFQPERSALTTTLLDTLKKKKKTPQSIIYTMDFKGILIYRKSFLLEMKIIKLT